MCALATGKTNCWLSYVTCPCNQEKAASLRYAHKLCQRVWDRRERPFIPMDDDGVGHVQAVVFNMVHGNGRA